MLRIRVKAKYKRLDEENVVKCGYCGREYLVPSWENIVKTSVELLSEYCEIDDRKRM